MFPGVLTTDSGFVLVQYYEDFKDNATQFIFGDSTASNMQPATERRPALMYDNFWVEIVIIDANGDGDTIQLQVDYKYRLVEMD